MIYEPTLVAVPSATEHEVAGVLEARGWFGRTISGSVVGREGWVFANVSVEVPWQFADELYEMDETLVDELRGVLTARWPEAQVEDIVIDGEPLSHWSLLSPVTPVTAVAVTPDHDLLLGLHVKVSGSRLGVVERDARLLIGGDVDEEDLVDILANAEGCSAVLWSRGPETGLRVLRRSTVRAEKVWSPAGSWFGVGREGEFDAAFLEDPAGDGAIGLMIGNVLRLDAAQAAHLKTLLRAPVPDLDELVTVLGLPPEVAAVVRGDVAILDLPEATAVEPRSLRQEMATMRLQQNQPRLTRALIRGSYELEPWYVALGAAFFLGGLGALCLGVVSGSPSWAVVGAVLALGEVVEVTVRWRAKRRRKRSRSS